MSAGDTNDAVQASPVRVLVAGASGRMGRETVAAVRQSAQTLGDMELVGVFGRGDDAHAEIKAARPEVLVDFSLPGGVMANVRAALASGVIPVVGTTGLSPSDLDEIAGLCQSRQTACLIAPNFAIGAVLMMQFAQTAARYLPDAEIIEMHHENKRDAPSGTAQKTAVLIAQAREAANVAPAPSADGAFETAPGARGGTVSGVPVHSVRLPGFVASQEVIFGGPGQRLSLRHDSIDRASFMPGVLLAIRKAHTMQGFVYGLENLLT